MLASAAEHHQRMQRLTAVAVVGARRRRRSFADLALFVAALQVLAAQHGARSVREAAEEQGLDPALVGAVLVQAFAGDTPNGQTLPVLLQQVSAPDVPEHALLRLVQTLIADGGRMGQAVATVATPSLVGHVRYVNPPCCGRCAVLAGQFYRWSDGFRRHPGCDCGMQPVGENIPNDAVTDPDELFRKGQIVGLSEADTAAVEAGAGLAKVVNVRRKAAGLTRAGRVLTRGAGRAEVLTPEGIFTLATSRDDAIRMLRAAGYLR